MNAAIKCLVVAAPFVLAFLLIRWLSGGEAERWRDRVEPFCPGAVVGVDEDGLIVVAGDRAQAAAAAAEVRDFRRVLAARYADLLGKPAFDRMVIVVFPDALNVQAYAGANARMDRGAAGKLHGYTDPTRGAVFVPADAIGTLRHETVHWVMETARGATSPPYSPWLSEGLAQLFETFDPARPGPPKPPRIALRDLDVDRLIRIEDYGEFLGRDDQRNYEEALVLAAFLFETRGAQLREYVAAERRSEESRAGAFRRIFRHRDEPFPSDLAAFIARRR